MFYVKFLKSKNDLFLLERLKEEIRRKFNVVSVFPNRTSVIRLGGSILMEQHNKWTAIDRSYMFADFMAELYIKPAVNTTSDSLTLPA